jgi:uncharacterized membrane-anchored protein
MDAQKAIELAKRFAQDYFAAEGVSNIRLEEVRRSSNGNWLITVGFRRDAAHSPVLVGLFKIDYKIFEIDANGAMVSLTDPEIAA